MLDLFVRHVAPKTGGSHQPGGGTFRWQRGSLGCCLPLRKLVVFCGCSRHRMIPPFLLYHTIRETQMAGNLLDGWEYRARFRVASVVSPSPKKHAQDRPIAIGKLGLSRVWGRTPLRLRVAAANQAMGHLVSAWSSSAAEILEAHHIRAVFCIQSRCRRTWLQLPAEARDAT